MSFVPAPLNRLTVGDGGESQLVFGQDIEVVSPPLGGQKVTGDHSIEVHPGDRGLVVIEHELIVLQVLPHEIPLGIGQPGGQTLAYFGPGQTGCLDGLVEESPVAALLGAGIDGNVVGVTLTLAQ